MLISTDRYGYATGVDTLARSHTLAIVEVGTGGEIETLAFPSKPTRHALATGCLRRRGGTPRAHSSRWRERTRTVPRIVRS